MLHCVLHVITNGYEAQEHFICLWAKECFQPPCKSKSSYYKCYKRTFLSQWKFYMSYKPNLMNFTALVITGTCIVLLT